MAESKKQEFERLAVRWVEKLLESSISFDTLVESMKYIEPRHYIDVVEERYIIKLCGWPQCGNELAGISKAKYHVSVKHKQVIDITERKKFCSSKCFNASLHFMAELSTEPVWLRMKRVNVAPKIDETNKADQTKGRPAIHEIVETDIIEKKMVTIAVADNDSDDEELPESGKLHKPEISVKDKLFQSLTIWTVPKQVFIERPDESASVNSTNNDTPFFIPAVHSITPSQVQCNIFISQIRTNLREMASLLDLTVHEVLPQLSLLAKSFRLTKDTIVFKPNEWKILISVMITSLQLADLTDHQLILQWLEKLQLTRTDYIEFVQHLRERLKYIITT